MTPRQIAFVDYYAASGNATEAARKAGYAKPNVEGTKNLAKPSIQQALAERTKEVTQSRIATIRERQEFWTSIMRGEDDEAEIKDRLKASELLGKCQGDFIDRQEITTLTPPNINVVIVESKQTIA